MSMSTRRAGTMDGEGVWECASSREGYQSGSGRDSCLAGAWEETGVWEETEAWKGQRPVRVQKPRGVRDMGRV